MGDGGLGSGGEGAAAGRQRGSLRQRRRWRGAHRRLGGGGTQVGAGGGWWWSEEPGPALPKPGEEEEEEAGEGPPGVGGTPEHGGAGLAPRNIQRGLDPGLWSYSVRGSGFKTTPHPPPRLAV